MLIAKPTMQPANHGLLDCPAWFPAAYCYRLKLCILLPLLLALTGCLSLSTPPRDRDDICSVFTQRPKWYQDAKRAALKWRGPISVSMSIMAQESAFKARAKPPIRFFLGIIPYGRASNAYGFPQALDSTWADYRRDAGNIFSQRDKFADAIDFIQWYMHNTQRINGVAKTDAYNQYLNYHEGQGGFKRGSHQTKQWLLGVARKVNARAKAYAEQLRQCQPRLDKSTKRFWFF